MKVKKKRIKNIKNSFQTSYISPSVGMHLAWLLVYMSASNPILAVFSFYYFFSPLGVECLRVCAFVYDVEIFFRTRNKHLIRVMCACLHTLHCSIYIFLGMLFALHNGSKCLCTFQCIHVATNIFGCIFMWSCLVFDCIRVQRTMAVNVFHFHTNGSFHFRWMHEALHCAFITFFFKKKTLPCSNSWVNDRLHGFVWFLSDFISIFICCCFRSQISFFLSLYLSLFLSALWNSSTSIVLLLHFPSYVIKYIPNNATVYMQKLIFHLSRSRRYLRSNE